MNTLRTLKTMKESEFFSFGNSKTTQLPSMNTSNTIDLQTSIDQFSHLPEKVKKIREDNYKFVASHQPKCKSKLEMGFCFDVG